MSQKLNRPKTIWIWFPVSIIIFEADTSAIFTFITVIISPIYKVPVSIYILEADTSEIFTFITTISPIY